MYITVAQRLRPFSHLPGTYFILPGTALRFQLFPALIRVHNLSDPEPVLVDEIPLDVKGPVKDFTMQQDLEKGILRVWGKTATGFMRYRILALPEEKIPYAIRVEKGTPLREKPPAAAPYFPVKTDRLSLGSHKAQDWDKMVLRSDLKEILPLWHRLGQLIPPTNTDYPQGTISLLKQCEEAINSGESTEIYPAFHNLFLAGFDLGLSPRLKDDQHQGFQLSPVSVKGISPLALLSEGAALIRRLFMQCKEHNIRILPSLPPEFHSGRLVQVPCGSWGNLDLEWSKKIVRRMVFTPAADITLNFDFQKQVKRFRLRTGENNPGQWLPNGSPVTMPAGFNYLFDRFEK